jgi:molecular chaperone HtpG
MAEVLYKKVAESKEQVPFIGHQMLDIVTSGMYDDPLMIYREYIQNSVDSIDAAVRDGVLRFAGGKISILISGQNRSVTIEDNGAGLSEYLACRVLVDLGCSSKEGTRQRGFRGIGRLGGLAYCDLLRFETRSSGKEKIVVVEWDKKSLENLTKRINQETSLPTLIKAITRTFTRRASGKDPERFFRVQMENVRKFHSDKLMNVKLIKEYLSQVAPVPYDSTKFSHAEKLDKYFASVAGYRGYDLTLNGEKILRPYSDKIHISSEHADEIKDIECFEFFTADGGPLALGWYAKTNFKASLPSEVTMRGIRVRHGNLEVGNEYFLSPYFKERRFATWNIGEIQIWDNHVKPNARRDGFEQTPEYERFLEQASLLGRRLSILCRRHSSDRSIKQSIEKKLEEIEHLLNGPFFFIDNEHYEKLTDMVKQELDKLLPLIRDKVGGENVLSKYKKIESKLIQFKKAPFFLDEFLDGRSIRHIEKGELVQKMVKLVLNEFDGCSSANNLVQKMVTPFLKPMAKKAFSRDR